ncbi:MAG: nuclear transport factor 2 family protein [Chloroflexia bacterium]
MNGNETAEAEEAKVEDELQLRMREFGQAWASSDIAKLESLLTTDYQHTDILGRILNRVEWLEYAQTARPVKSMEFQDVKLKFYDTVAVITGKNVIVGLPDSWDSNVSISFTQVWVREKGEWRRAFFQATPIIEQAKGD